MTQRTIHRVMLVTPPITLERDIETKRVSPPLGPAYIAAVLEQRGFEAAILDSVVEGFDQEEPIGDTRYRVGLSWNQIMDRVRAFTPDAIGVSCLFTDHVDNALDLCRRLRREFPDTPLITGGVHPTVAPEDMLAEPAVDYVLRGESDHTFAQLLEILNSGGDPEAVDGVAFRRNGGHVIRPKQNFIEDLNALPLPARHLLNYDLYFKINQYYRRPARRPPAMNIITSRCCPADCIFCSTRAMMGRYRTRSAENVLAEIESLKSNYGINELYFLDDNFTFDRERAAAILDGIIQREYDLAWSTPNGVAVYALDDELLHKMKQSGCYSLFFAIESADPYVLKNIMRKPVKVERIAPLVKTARGLGIEVHGLFVIGLPGETREQIQRTVDFADNTDFDYVTFSIATPYPGTRLLDVCRKQGWLIEPYEYSTLKFGRGNIRTDQFDPDYLETVRREAWDRINKKIRETKERAS